MGKLLIPIIVIGVVIAGYLFYKKVIHHESVPPPTASAPAASAKAPAAPAPSASPADKEKNNDFPFVASDPWISTPNSPWGSPQADYKVGRASTSGFVTAIQDGVAKVTDLHGNKGYIITDSGRPIRIKTKFTHTDHFKNRTVVYCNLDESLIEPSGLRVGKDVGYGKVTQVTSSFVRIERNDKGFTLITNTLLAPPKREEDLSPIQREEPPPEKEKEIIIAKDPNQDWRNNQSSLTAQTPTPTPTPEAPIYKKTGSVLYPIKKPSAAPPASAGGGTP